MKSHLHRQILRSERGFTLVEIMLAMLVLAAIMTMISMSLSGTFDVVDQTGKQGDVLYRSHVAFSRMGDDLASLFVDKSFGLRGEKGDADGKRADSLQFPSLGHVIFDHEKGRPGLAVITYYTEKVEDENGGEMLVLKRSDIPLLPGTEIDSEMVKKYGFILCDHLRSVSFDYTDGKGEEAEEWQGSAEDTEENEKMVWPASIRCTLEFVLDEQQQETFTVTTGFSMPASRLQEKQQEKNE